MVDLLFYQQSLYHWPTRTLVILPEHQESSYLCGSVGKHTISIYQILIHTQPEVMGLHPKQKKRHNWYQHISSPQETPSLVTIQFTWSFHQTRFVYKIMIINNNLTQSDHVTYFAQKANNVRAFLQRDLKQCVPSVKIKFTNHIFNSF